MAEFRIAVDLSGVFPVNAEFDAAHFPSLQEAVRVAAEAGQARWRAYASGAPLPSGHSVPARHQKPYAASIGLRQIGDFEAEIYSDYRYAEAIDDGEPARDLKRMLSTSAKVRRFKDGRRYLIIPFRWSTPGKTWSGGANEMTHAVREWWRGKPRTVTTQGGLRLGEDAVREAEEARLMGTGVRSDVLGRKARNMIGMYAFRKRGATGGAAANATFKTFRTMCEGQTGWVVPARPALEVSRITAAEVRAEAEASFTAAAMQDLGRLMGRLGPRPGGGGAIRRIPRR